MSAGSGTRRRKNLLPPLPPEAWGAIAQATLTAEGDDACSWATLRLVSPSWRDGLKGAATQMTSLRCRPDASCFCQPGVA